MCSFEVLTLRFTKSKTHDFNYPAAMAAPPRKPPLPRERQLRASDKVRHVKFDGTAHILFKHSLSAFLFVLGWS